MIFVRVKVNEVSVKCILFLRRLKYLNQQTLTFKAQQVKKLNFGIAASLGMYMRLPYKLLSCEVEQSQSFRSVALRLSSQALE